MSVAIGLSPDSLTAAIDGARYSRRFWATFALVVLMLVAEVFDFVITSFLVAEISSDWELTFGQAAVILLSFGIGSIVGAISLGWCGDRYGRKVVIVGGGILFTLCAGAIALIPEGDWILFSVLRFLVGFGFAGACASQFALMAEFTPTRHRTLITSSISLPGSLAIAMASLIAAELLPVIGWRGVAAIGALPVVVPIAFGFVAPESARWLAANGRFEEARAAVASLFGREVADSIEWEGAAARPETPAPKPARVPWEIFRHPRLFFLVLLTYTGTGAAMTGLLLWGPVVIAQVMEITAAEAASVFFLVSIAGLLGRISFTFIANWVGRLKAGYLAGYTPAVLLALAGLFHDANLFGISVFVLCLLVAFFFVDGGYVSLNPYAAEVYPVRMAARAMGLAQTSLGLGKILGPLMLALAAGTGNLISPESTREAILPAFLLLGGAMLASGLAYSLLGVETHRKPLKLV